MLITAAEYKTPKFPERDYIEIGEVDPDEGVDAAPEIVPELHDSLYTADDLAVMTIRELRELPEFTRIPTDERRGIRLKQDYVDAILNARRGPSQDEPARATLD
jgi:hypothetical protein